MTTYQPLAIVQLPIPVGRYNTSRYLLFQVLPRTGRKHQIRRHMKNIFRPIVGDTSYGDGVHNKMVFTIKWCSQKNGVHNKMFRELLRCRRLLLHTRRLCFTHPYSNQHVTIGAPLDLEFARVVQLY